MRFFVITILAMFLPVFFTSLVASFVHMDLSLLNPYNWNVAVRVLVCGLWLVSLFVVFVGWITHKEDAAKLD